MQTSRRCQKLLLTSITSGGNSQEIENVRVSQELLRISKKINKETKTVIVFVGANKASLMMMFSLFCYCPGIFFIEWTNDKL